LEAIWFTILSADHGPASWNHTVPERRVGSTQKVSFAKTRENAITTRLW